VAVRFVIEGDLRFISHHDTMRLFERALSRTRLPIRYSEGFNPRPKLSLPLPRAVGTASEADVLVFELRQPVEAAAALKRLARQMPPGLTLAEAWALDGRRGPRAEQVEYALALPPDAVEPVTAAVDRLLAAPTCRVDRTGPGGERGKTIDLRAYLADVSIRDATLRWSARVTESGSARPAELLTAVGLRPDECLHRVRRTAVRWVTESPTAKPADSAQS